MQWLLGGCPPSKGWCPHHQAISPPPTSLGWAQHLRPAPCSTAPQQSALDRGLSGPGRAFLCQPFCLNARTAFPTWANCAPYWSRGVTATWPFRVPSVGTTPHTQCTVPSTLIYSTITRCTTEQTQYPKSMVPLTACPQNYPQVQKLSWEMPLLRKSKHPRRK